MRSRGLVICSLALACACGSKSSDTRGGAKDSGPLLAATSLDGSSTTPSASTTLTPANSGSALAAGNTNDAGIYGQSSPAAPMSFAAWLRTKVPASAKIVSEGGTTKVIHTVAAGDTALSIANQYLDVTDVYYAKDLAAMIAQSASSLPPGATVEIPHLLAEAYKDPEADRMRWPEDRVIRGVFITGAYAAILWPQTLDKLAVRKQFNAVVLDAKDYQGPVNYATKAKIAREIEADKDFKIPDMARAIRFAHMRGIRVILRIPCFHDPLAAKKVKRLSLMSLAGNPIDMGWLDPMNEEAQGYVLDLVHEAIDNGADEIQLDYIRFPVVGPTKQMKLPPPKNGERIRDIRDIVRKVHAVTSASQVPLSLDIFGVTATGERNDWEALGQDISVLGAECEALSPMVYPSHYDDGYRGFAHPGEHPEIIGIGTRMAVNYLPKGKKSAVIRSWLQAFGWKAPNYGTKYLVEEARQAESNGGAGWLMWSPANEYSAAWNGFPPSAPAPSAAPSASAKSPSK